MELQTLGVRRYPSTSPLLNSSAGLGWSTISVELRFHGVCEAPAVVPQYAEICLVIVGNKDGRLRRTVAGLYQEEAAKPGAIWLSPAGVGKEIAVTAPIPQTMHLYLPTALFDRLKDDFNLPVAPGHSIRHAAGIRDDVIHQIGLSILSELSGETAAGRMFAETAAATLAARLMQKYCDCGVCNAVEPTTHRIDQARLRRVLDYIAANLDEEFTLAQLAEVAGVSIFHFARTFSRTMGISPSRYVSRLRLEKAMTEIASGKLSLAEIAFRAGFSSQASFTRAFHRMTAVTPAEYRARRQG